MNHASEMPHETAPLLAPEVRAKAIDRLVEDFVSSLLGDRRGKYDVGRKGFKGFENMSDEEIVSAYSDAFEECLTSPRTKRSRA